MGLPTQDLLNIIQAMSDKIKKPNESIVAFWVRTYLERAFPEVLEYDAHRKTRILASIADQDAPSDQDSEPQPVGNVYKFPDRFSHPRPPKK